MPPALEAWSLNHWTIRDDNHIITFILYTLHFTEFFHRHELSGPKQQLRDVRSFTEGLETEDLLKSHSH